MTTATHRIGILGVGYAVPKTIRNNCDPLFDWLKAARPEGTKLFAGYRERRVLGPGETVRGLMDQTVEATMANAGCKPADIGMLLGYVSVSEFEAPNELGHVHTSLELPQSTPIIPINNEFNNFPTAIMLARGLMLGGMKGNALIVCGGNWSRHVDYHTPQSISAADGAGGLVLGPVTAEDAWLLTDNETGVWSKNFGAMYMVGAPVATDYDCDTNPHHCTYTTSFFQISESGIEMFKEFGMVGVPTVVNAMLERNGLKGADIALVTHQASAVLMNYWKEKIAPAAYLETLEEYANMCIANLPVNLAHGFDAIDQDNLVVCGIGEEGQVNAVLFQRKQD